MAEKLTSAGLVVGLIIEDEEKAPVQEPEAPVQEATPVKQPVQPKRGRKTKA